MPESTLKKLMPKWLYEKLGEPTGTESVLFYNIQKGEPLDLRKGQPDIDDPIKADDWVPEREIRAEFLRWICTDKKVSELIDGRGIQIYGAKIKGELDFEGLTIPHTVVLGFCSVSDGIIFRDAQTRTINLFCTHTGPISGERLTVNGAFFFNKCCALGEVRLSGAKIGSDLTCLDASFINENGPALNASGIETNGSIFLKDGFNAKGEVILIGAKIGGSLSCSKGRFVNENGRAFIADRIETNDSIFFKDTLSRGEVRLQGAKIGGALDCSNGSFINENGEALYVDGIEIKRNILLKNDFSAKGSVRLLGAKVGGSLDCSNGNFINEKGLALFADGIEVKGGIFFNNGFNAKGEVRLIGGKVDSDFSCSEGTFFNENGRALNIERIIVKGNFSLKLKRKPIGKIDLMHAKVGVMTDDIKSWPEPGKLRIDGFEYDALAPDNTPKDAKRLKWIELQYDPIPKIPNLEPLQNKYIIKWIWMPFFELIKKTNGYNKLKEKFISIWKEINGFNLYCNSEKYTNFKYMPQPYEQLAKVLKNMGHENDSKEVLIAKQEVLRKNGNISRLRRHWRWFLGFTMGYGYKPTMPILINLFLISLGFFIFGYGDENGYMVQSKMSVFKEKSFLYPEFNPFIYSLDTLIPFLDLHQESYWIPAYKNGHPCWSGLLHIYLWFHIIIGWVFTTLSALSLSGVVRK